MEIGYEYLLLTNHLLFSKQIKEDLKNLKLEMININYIESLQSLAEKKVFQNAYPIKVKSNLEKIIDHYIVVIEDIKTKINESNNKSNVKAEDKLEEIKNLSTILEKIKEMNRNLIGSYEELTRDNRQIYFNEFNKRYTNLSDFLSPMQGVSVEHLEDSIYTDYIAFTAIQEVDSLYKYKNDLLFLESLNRIFYDRKEIFLDSKIRKNILVFLKENIESTYNQVVKRNSIVLVSKIESVKKRNIDLAFDINSFKNVLNYLKIKDMAYGLREEEISNLVDRVKNTYPSKDLSIVEVNEINSLLNDKQVKNICIKEAKDKYSLLKFLTTKLLLSLDTEDESYIKDAKYSITYDLEVFKLLFSSSEEYNLALENGFFECDEFIYTIKSIIKNYPFVLTDLQVSNRLIDALSLSDNKKYIKKIESYIKRSNC